MSTSLVSFATFKEASDFAKFAAKVLNVTISIARREIDDGVEVYLPDDADRVLQHSGQFGHFFSRVREIEAAEEEIREAELDAREAPSREFDDESEEIGEEIDDCRESSARSEEEGWYYSEDD